MQERPSGAQAHAIAADTFRPSTRALALKNEEPPADAEAEAEEGRRTSEELEEKQYQALLAKQGKCKKRPAAVAVACVKVKAKGKGPAAAAPKAKGKSKVAKKVVGKVHKLDYKVTWSPKEGDHKRIRNVYQCKCYNRAKAELIKVKHISPDDFKATLSDVQFKAGQMWDKHMDKS